MGPHTVVYCMAAAWHSPYGTKLTYTHRHAYIYSTKVVGRCLLDLDHFEALRMQGCILDGPQVLKPAAYVHTLFILIGASCLSMQMGRSGYVHHILGCKLVVQPGPGAILCLEPLAIATMDKDLQDVLGPAGLNAISRISPATRTEAQKPSSTLQLHLLPRERIAYVASGPRDQPQSAPGSPGQGRVHGCLRMPCTRPRASSGQMPTAHPEHTMA